jgi:hypothetical protein
LRGRTQKDLFVEKSRLAVWTHEKLITILGECVPLTWHIRYSSLFSFPVSWLCTLFYLWILCCVSRRRGGFVSTLRRRVVNEKKQDKETKCIDYQD